MSQALANKLQVEFSGVTGISCDATFLEKGIGHRPTNLPSSCMGVYVFLEGVNCFKVGKVGPNSQPRWTSQHYCLDARTSSTFPKSIIKHKEFFKKSFPSFKGCEIDSLDSENVRGWIQDNFSRMEFIISSDESKFALNLLEALVQFRLSPVFEGKTPCWDFASD